MKRRWMFLAAGIVAAAMNHLLADDLPPMLQVAPPPQIETVAQESKIHFVGHWKQGDVFHFDIKKTERRAAAGTEPTQGIATYRATVRVVEKAADFSVLEWTYSDFDLQGVADENNEKPLAEAFLKSLVVRYRVNAAGGIVRMENWDDVKNTILAVDDLSQAKKPPAERKNQHDAMVQFLNDPKIRQAREIVLMQEQEIVHTFFGVTLGKDKVVRHSTLNNPAGPGQIPDTLTVELLDVTGNRARARLHSEPDPEAIPLVEKASGQKLDAPDAFKFYRTVEETIDLEQGMPVSIHYEKALKIGAFLQSETIEMTAAAAKDGVPAK